MGIKPIFTAARNDVPVSKLDTIELTVPHVPPGFAFAPKRVPLSERDVVEIDKELFDGIKPEKWEGRAINFQYILKTGSIPMYSDISGDISKPGIPKKVGDNPWEIEQYIDFEAGDELNAVLKLVEANSIERISEHFGLLFLLGGKEEWDQDNREMWEREVSAIVSDEFNNIRGLDTYRVTDDEGCETRVSRLNDLSSDIRNGTTKIEHDCETMSTLEGIVLQRLDNSMLPEHAPDGDMKVASNYFYVSGQMNIAPGHFDLSGHAYIISSATGNIIEGTHDPDTDSMQTVYLKSIDPDFSFDKFVRTGFAVCEDKSIYTGKTHDAGDIASYRVNEGQINLFGLFEKTDAKWAEGERFDPNTLEVIKLETESTAPAKRDMGALIAIPPEVQALAETKARMMEFQERELSTQSPHLEAKYSFDAMMMRRRFDNQVDDMIEDGSIYEVLKFLNDSGALNYSSASGPDTEPEPAVPVNSSEPEVKAPVLDQGFD